MAKKIDSQSAKESDSAAEADRAQKIWLAGLGAFAKAQQEGGKVFESLVSDGLAWQRQTQDLAKAQVAEATHKFSAIAGSLGSRAGQQFDRLEGIFEQRVAKALQRLDIAKQSDLEALQERVEALAAQVQALQRPARATRKTTATPTQSAGKTPARPRRRASP